MFFIDPSGEIGDPFSYSGNYCGANEYGQEYDGGPGYVEEPVDDRDYACRDHDQGLTNVRKKYHIKNGDLWAFVTKYPLMVAERYFVDHKLAVNGYIDSFKRLTRGDIEGSIESYIMATVMLYGLGTTFEVLADVFYYGGGIFSEINSPGLNLAGFEFSPSFVFGSATGKVKYVNQPTSDNRSVYKKSTTVYTNYLSFNFIKRMKQNWSFGFGVEYLSLEYDRKQSIPKDSKLNTARPSLKVNLEYSF